MTDSANHTHPELERRIANLEQLLESNRRAQGVSTKPVAIREFMQSQGPRSDLQKTLVIAYFLEAFEGTVPFTVDDLRDAYSRARESGPRNLNDSVNKNIRKGLLMEARERKGKLKAWVVTSSGERAVTNGFSSPVARTGHSTK